MATLESMHDFVKDKLVKERWTHSKISGYLQQAHPGIQGFNIHSVQRFCSVNSIHKTSKLSDQQLDQVVSNQIEQVCEL